MFDRKKLTRTEKKKNVCIITRSKTLGAIVPEKYVTETNDWRERIIEE